MSDAPRPVALASLRLQVFRDGYVGMRVLASRGGAIRPLAPGLTQAIVEDIGNGAGSRVLTWSSLRGHGSEDELFERARRQAAAVDREVATYLVADLIQVFSCNGFYLSAKLLDHFIVTPLARGALVVPVSWHHWCVVAIDDLTVPEMAQAMQLIARDLAANMEGTDAEQLGTELYCVQPGGRVVERLETTIGPDGTPVPVPSAALLRALGR